MVNLVRIMLMVAVSGTLSTDAHGQQGEKARPERVASLVRQLGSPSFAAREDAAAALRKLGVTSRPQLLAASRVGDAEIALRAEKLLAELATNDLWLGSRVELSSESRDLHQVVAELALQSGNQLRLGEGTVRDAHVRIPTTRGQFWPLVDSVAREAKLTVQAAKDADGWLLVPQSGSNEALVAHAGAVRGKLTAIRRNGDARHVREGFKSSEFHRIELHVALTWEQHLEVVGHETPQVVEAVTDAGERLVPVPPQHAAWTSTEANKPSACAALALPVPQQPAQTLTTLRLRWPLVGVGDRCAVYLRDLNPGAEFVQDELLIRMAQRLALPDGRWRLELEIDRTSRQAKPAGGQLEGFTAEVFDERGTLFDLRHRQARVIGGKPRLTFVVEHPIAPTQPKSLRLIYPRLRAERAVELTFRDVPLPPGCVK